MIDEVSSHDVELSEMWLVISPLSRPTIKEKRETNTRQRIRRSSCKLATSNSTSRKLLGPPDCAGTSCINQVILLYCLYSKRLQRFERIRSIDISSRIAARMYGKMFTSRDTPVKFSTTVYSCS